MLSFAALVGAGECSSRVCAATVCVIRTRIRGIEDPSAVQTVDLATRSVPFQGVEVVLPPYRRGGQAVGHRRLGGEK